MLSKLPRTWGNFESVKVTPLLSKLPCHGVRLSCHWVSRPPKYYCFTLDFDCSSICIITNAATILFGIHRDWICDVKLSNNTLRGNFDSLIDEVTLIEFGATLIDFDYRPNLSSSIFSDPVHVILGTGQYLWEYGTRKFATGPPVILVL